MKSLVVLHAGSRGARFAGATKDAIVITQDGALSSFDVRTGKPLDIGPARFEPAREASRALQVGRTTFAVSSADDGLALHVEGRGRKGSLVRNLSPAAVWALAGELLVVVDVDRDDPREGQEARHWFVVGADGASVAVRGLPTWLLPSGSGALLSSTAASALVVESEEGVVWIAWRTLSDLFRARGEVEVSAALESHGDVRPTVTRVRLPGDPGVVPVNSILLAFGGWQAMVQSPRASSVKVGERLVVRKVKGAPVLFDAKGVELARGGNLDQLFRASRDEEERLAGVTVSVERLALPHVRAERMRGAEATKAIGALRRLGIASELEGDRLDTLTLRTLFFDAEAEAEEKVRKLLAAHFHERPPAPTEALHAAAPARWIELFAGRRDVRIIADAPRVTVEAPGLSGRYVATTVRSHVAVANLVLAATKDARRYRTVVLDEADDDVVALLVDSAGVRVVKSIVSVEPLAGEALAVDAALSTSAIEAALRDLVDAGEHEIVVTKGTGAARVRLRFSPLAAATLVKTLR